MTKARTPETATPGERAKLPSAIATGSVVLATSVAATLAAFSLRWPLVHDLPIVLYEGFLMHDLGRVPYRDFFEINSPGTLLLYSFMHQVTAGELVALRVVDMIALAAICGFTMLALRSHGLRSGMLASALISIAYLAEGPGQSLQREYLCLLPLAISLVLAFRVDDSSRRPWLTMGAMGLLAGIATCIKPPLLLCWTPLVLMVLATRLESVRRRTGSMLKEGSRLLLPLAAGILSPMLVIAWMLARDDALGIYFEIVRDYYPLYAELTGGGGLWPLGGVGLVLRRYIGVGLDLVLGFRFVMVSCVGLALAWRVRGRPQFAQCVTVCGLVLFGVLYVSICGKFFLYHSFPLFYGLALLAGLSVSRAFDRAPAKSTLRNAVICVAVVVGLPVNMIGHEFGEWRSGSTLVVKRGRVDLVAEYLEEKTDPSETVMVLDVTSGALHALYRNRRPLYGRFIYDFHVYHHIDDPYIQRLRSEMLSQFHDGEPDIVVRFDKTWLRKPNFPELSAILENDYDVALQENDVSILRLRTHTRHPGIAEPLRQ